MPVKIIDKFEVKYLQILDENGICDEKLKPKLRPNELKRLYESMILCRVYDKYSLSLQRQGRIGTFIPITGHEAIHSGSALATQDTDWIVPSFRCEGVHISKGIPISSILQVYGGDERGSISPKNINILPISIPVSTQIPHACGIAYAAKLKKKKIGVLAFFGDGATSKGDFHEAMNIAGVFKLPVVFICQNNQYAISVPVNKQTASKTLAQKSISYGFEGIKVDGNDIFAVYKTIKEALKKARENKGPTLIECFTYRTSDHTTADDASRYRTKKEVEKWKKKDPIERFAKYLIKKKIINQDYITKVQKKAEDTVSDEIKKYESIPKADPSDILKYVYENQTDELKEQMSELELRKKLKNG